MTRSVCGDHAYIYGKVSDTCGDAVSSNTATDHVGRFSGKPAPGSKDTRHRWVFGSEAARLADRFWSKVKKGDPDVCWPWLGAKSAKNYGQWHPAAGVHIPAHRFALILKLGRDLGPTEVAMHLCHYRPCCNPNHLIAGTQSDNMRHSAREGLAYVGELNSMARFTDEVVMDLRQRAALEYRHGWLTQEAKRLGTKNSVISRIVRGVDWRHLPGAVEVGYHKHGRSLARLAGAQIRGAA